MRGAGLLLLALLFAPAPAARTASEAASLGGMDRSQVLDFSTVAIPREWLLEEPPASARMTRAQALAIGLRDNPGLEAAREAVEMARGDYIHSSAANDPQLSLGAEWTPNVRSSDEPNINQFPGMDLTYLSYTFPASGVRKWSTRAADGRFRAAQASYDAAQVGLRAAVKTAYANLQQARDGWKLDRQVYQIAESLLLLTEKGFRAGALRELDVMQARIAAKQAEQTLIGARFNLLSQEAALDFQLGRPSTQRIAAADPMVARTVDASMADLLKLGYEERSDLKAAKATRDSRRAGVPLAVTAYRPDLTLQGSYQTHTAGSSAPPFTAAVAWPLYDRGQVGGSVLQARAAAHQASDLVDSTTAGVWRDVEVAFTNVQADLEGLRVSQQVILPKTLDQLKRTRLGYLAGATTLLDVLNAQQTYRQVALAYVAAATKLLQDMATLEGAVDAPVESTVGPNVIRLQAEDIMRMAASAK